MRAFAYLAGAAVVLGALLMTRRASAAQVAPDKMSGDVPRGIHNNNPGNLRPGDHWQGLAGVDSSNYLIFDTPENGLRALTINLVHQETRHGLNTVRGIISKWAPLSENPAQAAYIANVARAVGVGADDPLDLLHDRRQLQAFVLAIVRQENGVQPYGDETIARGIGAGARDA